MAKILFRRAVPRVLPLEDLREATGCDVTALPGQIAVVGRLSDGAWVSSRLADPVHAERLSWLLGLFDALPGPLPRSTWWSLVCLDDAWREGVRHHPETVWAPTRWHAGDALVAGQAPLLSDLRPVVLAFGRHVGDTTAALVPESHWIWSHGYLRTRLELPLQDRPWSWKQPRAVYAAGRNGRAESFRDPALTTDPRTRLAELAAEHGWDVDVTLGGAVTRRAQLARRVLLDVDGFARTWDAWAWKQLSRSAVVVQDSVWETFFTRQFRAGQDFVSVRNDLSDVGQVLDGLRTDPARARAVADAGRRRAAQVYAPRAVRTAVAEQLEPLLLGDGRPTG